MPTGAEGVNDTFRNQQVNVSSFGAEMPTATATAGAATLNSLVGVVTTNSSTAAFDTAYTLAITNNKVAAGDLCFPTITLASGTAQSYHVQSVVCTANTITITIQNGDVDTAWVAAVFTVGFFVVKKLVAGVPSS